MHIAKVNVARVVNPHSCRKRRPRTRHSIAVIVRNGDVLRPVKFQRQRLRTFARFFLGLRCVHVPVLHMVELDLVAYVMLGRELVHMPRRLRVRNQKARLRKRVRRPDIGECPSAAVASPTGSDTARPSACAGRNRPCGCCCRDWCRCHARRESEHRPSANRSPAFHNTATARGLIPPAKNPNAAHDVRPAGRRQDNRLRRAHALIARRRIQQIKLRRSSDAARSAPCPASA